MDDIEDYEPDERIRIMSEFLTCLYEKLNYPLGNTQEGFALWLEKELQEMGWLPY